MFIAQPRERIERILQITADRVKRISDTEHVPRSVLEWTVSANADVDECLNWIGAAICETELTKHAPAIPRNAWNLFKVLIERIGNGPTARLLLDRPVGRWQDDVSELIEWRRGLIAPGRAQSLMTGLVSEVRHVSEGRHDSHALLKQIAESDRG